MVTINHRFYCIAKPNTLTISERLASIALADLGGPKGPWPPPALKNIHSEWPFFMHKQYIFEKFSASLCSAYFFYS